MRKLALVLAALACAGCAGPPPPRTAADLEPGVFTIGYAAVSPRDAQLVRSARLAIEEVNEKGGVEGSVRLELVVGEAAGEPGDVARRLVLGGVQALILSCEPEAERAQAEVADRTQVLSFGPCNEDPTISERYPAVWPVSLGANAEAAALVDHALAKGYESLRPLDVWEPMARYLREAAAARDIEIVARGGDAELGTHRLDGSDPPPGVAFTTYGFPSSGSATAELYERYAARYGRKPWASWMLLGYDAVRVLASAIAGAGEADPAKVGERLASGLAVQGGLGEIVYPGGGERQPETPVAVVAVEGGKEVLLERSLPEAVPAP